MSCCLPLIITGGLGALAITGIAYKIASAEPSAPSIKPSSELFAQAVAAGNLAVAKNIIAAFPNNSAKHQAFAFRNCHHGKPLGTAVELGDVAMTQFILSHLSDEEAASGSQCSTIECLDDPSSGSKRGECPNSNAALIALTRCAWKKNYPNDAHGQAYPCDEILNVLRKRDVFQILRPKENKDLSSSTSKTIK